MKVKGKFLRYKYIVTFIIHVHCVYQLLPSTMKDIPLPSALLPTVVKLWEVLCAVSQITCHQMTSLRFWHMDFEDLYSKLSNESPPQNASNQFHQKVSLASVQIYNKDETLLYSVYTGQTMGSTLLTHQRKEICNSLHACNGIPCPKTYRYTPIRKFETIFM